MVHLPTANHPSLYSRSRLMSIISDESGSVVKARSPTMGGAAEGAVGTRSPAKTLALLVG